ncbi:MAG TPA: peptidoglycan DD-metalloendopeptidase family protein [Micromonosporaceae bacterium]
MTVQRGDWLAAIASRLCGNPNRWPQIYRANPAIKDPDLIYVGQRLLVPCATTGRTDSRASRSTTTRTNSSTARSAPAKSTTDSWVHPLPGSRLTDCWGAGRNHKGIDLARPTGTPIRAAAAGTITQAGWLWSGYGISVVVRHGNGVYTHYAHMSREIVAVGASVRTGQTIGYVGTTGQVTGPHLHFEVGLGGVLGHQVNPAPYLRARGVSIGC